MGKKMRFVMGWSDEDQAEEVVYASNKAEAEVKYANGDYELE